MDSLDTHWLILGGMFLVTFGVRWVGLAAMRDRQPPEWFRQALGFVPVAALSAIAVPAMVLTDGGLDIRLSNPYLVAGLVSIVVAATARRLMITICVGLVSFFLYQWAIVGIG